MLANPILANPFLDLVCVMVGPQGWGSNPEKIGPEGWAPKGGGPTGWAPKGGGPKGGAQKVGPQRVVDPALFLTSVVTIVYSRASHLFGGLLFFASCLRVWRSALRVASSQTGLCA